MARKYYAKAQKCYVVDGRIYTPALGQLAPDDIKAIVAMGAIKCDSKREARRLIELQTLQRAGEIRNLALQMKMPIFVNEKEVCKYVADFVYIVKATGEKVVEDTKGSWTTPIFNLKWKMVQAQYPSFTFFKNAQKRKKRTIKRCFK